MIDDPSPLLAHLPARLLSGSDASALQAESDLLDRLAFVSCLSRQGETLLQRAFKDGAKGLADDLSRTDVLDAFWERMRPYTRLAFDGAASIASAAKKGTAHRLRWLEEDYVPRVLPRWLENSGKNRKKPRADANAKVILRVFRALPAVLCQRIALGDDASSSSMLLLFLFESLLFEQYYSLRFAGLSEAKKADPTHPTTRRMFWAASFVFQHVAPGEPPHEERRALFHEVRDCLARLDSLDARIRLTRTAMAASGDASQGLAEEQLRHMRDVRERAKRLEPGPDTIAELTRSVLLNEVFCQLLLLDDDEEQQAQAPPPIAARLDEGASLADATRDIDAMLQAVVVDLDHHDDDDDDRTVARLLQRAEEEEAQRRAVRLTMDALVDSVVLEAAVDKAADAACEALMEDLAAQAHVLSGLHNVPASFARTLLAHFVPDIAHLLDNECFICLATLTDYRGVRYLTCCDGGAFACSECVEGHAARVGHPLRAEERIVALVAQLRRSLCR